MRALKWTPAFLLFTLYSCYDPAAPTSDQVDSTNTAQVADSAAIVEKPLNFSAGGNTLNSFVAYDSTKNNKRPIVLVIPEWWGINQYPRDRARQLAALGYLAVTVDMYGNGQVAPDPGAAMKMATPFYSDPQMGKARIDAALAAAQALPQADSSRTAAIGYCFGGTMVINAAKLGSDLDGVVSFHGGLEGPAPDSSKLKARVLVAHGGADSMVPQPQVDAFRKSMDSVKAHYTFKVYPDATHAFTNPAATATGEKFKLPIRYNKTADAQSWNDMKAFLQEIFK